MSLDKLRALDEAAKLEPEGLTWVEIAPAKAQLAALSKLLRPAFEALGPFLDRPWEHIANRKKADTVLVQLEEALSPLPFEVQGDVKIVWESEEALK